jgi:hypothetical protein
MAATKPKLNKIAERLQAQADGNKPTAVAATAEPKTPTRKEAARNGLVMVSAWLPLEARASLLLIRVKHPKKTTQDLACEAFNDLFAKYNVPQTANRTT